jgi:biotin carboxyl carrier protein
MTFEIGVGNGVRAVSVTRQGSLLHVSVDGRTMVVDARRVGDLELSLLVAPEGAADAVKSVDASLAVQRTAGDFDVHVAGRTIPVQVRVAGGFGRQKKAGAAQGTGPQRIMAPMPGKIVRVLVKPGDEVKARQGLVVVEAMKMENELRAARDGRVRDIAVTEGQSVDAGALLLVVE